MDGAAVGRGKRYGVLIGAFSGPGARWTSAMGVAERPAGVAACGFGLRRQGWAPADGVGKGSRRDSGHRGKVPVEAGVFGLEPWRGVFIERADLVVAE